MHWKTKKKKRVSILHLHQTVRFTRATSTRVQALYHNHLRKCRVNCAAHRQATHKSQASQLRERRQRQRIAIARQWGEWTAKPQKPTKGTTFCLKAQAMSSKGEANRPQMMFDIDSFPLYVDNCASSSVTNSLNDFIGTTKIRQSDTRHQWNGKCHTGRYSAVAHLGRLWRETHTYSSKYLLCSTLSSSPTVTTTLGTSGKRRLPAKEWYMERYIQGFNHHVLESRQEQAHSPYAPREQCRHVPYRTQYPVIHADVLFHRRIGTTSRQSNYDQLNRSRGHPVSRK